MTMYELPKIVIKDNWITKKYGFEVFKGSNPHVSTMFISLPTGNAIPATEEMLDDHPTMEYLIKKGLEV